MKIVVLILALGASFACRADPYLMIPGIVGKAPEPERPGWIGIQSYSLSVTDGGCRGVKVAKPVDDTSNALLTAALTKQRFSRVELDTDKPPSSRALRIRMLDATIKSIQLVTTSGGAASEQLQFEAARVIVEFWTVGESGFRQTAESSFTCDPTLKPSPTG